MPKIRIREQDKTAGSSTYANDNIVFIPTALVNSNKKTVGTLDEPILLEYGDDTSSYVEKTDIDYILGYGGKVVVGKSYADALEYLKDRNQFDIKFLLVKNPVKESAAEGAETETSDLEYALQIAASRRDCVVIYSAQDVTFNAKEKSLLTGGVGGDDFLSKESPLTVGKYCLAFYGKGLVNPDTDEEINSGIAYLLAFLNSVNEGNPEWSAVAGAKRGKLPISASAGFLKESEIDDMQPTTSTDTAFAINPIIKMNPWGVRIWGDRSCLAVDSDGLKASHFANIRILVCDIKKALYKAARQYQFEQNNDVLWVNFQSSVNTKLEEMKQSYGISGYRWIKEDTDEKAKLKATLKVVPVAPFEDLDLTLVLTDSLDVSEE